MRLGLQRAVSGGENLKAQKGRRSRRSWIDSRRAAGGRAVSPKKRAIKPRLTAAPSPLRLASTRCRAIPCAPHTHAALSVPRGFARAAPLEARMVRQRAPRELAVRDSPQQAGFFEDPCSWQLVPLVTTEVSQAVDVNVGAEIKFGSAPGSDVRIDSVEGSEVTVKATSEGLFVSNTGSGAGLEIEGRGLRSGESALLKDNGKVIIGGVAFLARSLEPLTPTSVTGKTEASTAGDEASRVASSFAQSASSGGATGTATSYAQWLVSLGLLYIGNKALAQATARAGIAFPAPLIGMFGIIGALFAVSSQSQSTADRVLDFFQPALLWIQRWLPLFYVPTLVVVPLAVQGIQGNALLRMLLVILVGMPASLFVTATVAKQIRNATNTSLLPTEPVPASPPFSLKHHIGWGGLAAASLAAAFFGPAEWATRLVVPFMLAATVEGLLLGSALPADVGKWVHPLITCALFANAGAAAFSATVGWGYKESLRLYITKGTTAATGGGDILMSFLGVVILSFGFRIFGQRRLMVRHAPEIFGSTTISAAFSLFGTAAFARVLGLAPEIARALAPRSVTVALALPIAAQLNAPASIAAAGVALTGLLGSNSVQLLLNKLGHRDPIARGLATAGASHGLGTAALAGKEPEALPFCALAYALIGIISTVLVTIPPIRAALIAVAG